MIDKLFLRRSPVFLVIGAVPSFVKVGRTKAAATLTPWQHRGHVRPEWVVLLRGMRDALQQTSHKHMWDTRHMGPHPTARLCILSCAYSSKLKVADLFFVVTSRHRSRPR